MSVKRPIVRWHGGKWLLAPWIISHFPRHRVYVEPFGGGASVLLRKPRAYSEAYNDLDGEIVNLFRVARDQGERLAEMLRMTPFARDEFMASYEAATCPIEQARRTVVRSFMGFGSNAHNKRTGFRQHARRSGTTPAADWAHYGQCFDALVERLAGVTIEHRDAREVIAAQDSPETLHYIDPPYVPETRDAGSDYRHEMTEADHVALAEQLRSVRGMVVLSGYTSDLYARLYAGWQRLDRHALADGARKRVESLWLSPNMPAMGLFSEARP